MIFNIIECLKSQNDILRYSNVSPQSIRIVYTNKTKRFTEFYRIRVLYTNKKKQYFWIRIVKNKPENEITDALNSQFLIMKKVYNHFKKKDRGLYLTCCEPIALLHSYNALITKECNGVLFNLLLKHTIPIFSKKRLSDIFYNCGVWLGQFHKLYANDNISELQFQKKMISFKKQHGRDPIPKYRYITKCHNDYTPRNIFVGRNLVDVIDFVGVKDGFPEEDLSYFSKYFLNARFNGLYSKKIKYYLLDCFYNGYNTPA